MDEDSTPEWAEYDGGAVEDRHRNASRIRVVSGVTVLPARVFRNCDNLRVVDLSNVTTISRDAFESNASEVEIGTLAFAYCKGLRDIDLSRVTKIGRSAFVSCCALKRVTIPSSMVEIGEGAFRDCKSLMTVELGEGIQRIGYGAFQDCRSLVSVTIPSTVTDIEAYAFYGCKSLEGVELNEGLKHIGERAFTDCSLLRINIPSSASYVGHYAFSGCHQLRFAELQEGLQVISARAFKGCSLLERVIIPSSVKSVGESAFENCTSLAELTLREGVQFIGEGAFSTSQVRTIKIPPIAFVVYTGSSGYQLMRGSCQLFSHTTRVTFGRKLVISKWLQYRSPGQLAQAEAKVNEILSRPRLTEEEKIASVRKWFAYYDLLDVAAMLELAIWRCNMDGNEQNAEARQASLRNCGNDMNVIIPGVLPFLEDDDDDDDDDESTVQSPTQST